MIRLSLYRVKVIANFVFRFQFVSYRVPDRKTDHKFDSQIPNTVFQTSSKDRIPRALHKDVTFLRFQNSDLNYILFDNDEMNRWMAKNFVGTLIYEAFTNAKFGVMRSDIFRYCYAYRHGGISLDLTKGLTQTLSSKFMLPGVTMILSQERNQINEFSPMYSWFESQGLKPNLLISWCFAVAPNHPALLNVLSEIENNYKKMVDVPYCDVKSAIWVGTGPIAFNSGLINFYKSGLLHEVKVSDIDFGETDWPKFRSSIYLNSFAKHYTDLENKVIWVSNKK
jgi:mannosyltransferase OCH1-like enzyme